MRAFFKAAVLFLIGVAVGAPVGRAATAVPSNNVAGKFHWSRWSEADGGNGYWYGFREDWEKRITYARATALAAATGFPLVKFDDGAETAHLLKAMEWEYFEVWIGDSMDAEGNAATISWRGVITSRPSDFTLGATVFRNATSPFELPPVIASTNAPFRISVGATNIIGFEFVSFNAASYQWRFNGEPLAGQTGATLNLLMDSPNQSGAYDLIVRNFYGSATSAPVQVTVTVPAPISITMSRYLKDFLRMDFVIEADVDQMDLEYTTDFKTWVAIRMPKVYGPVQHYERMDMAAPRRYYRLHRYP